MQRILIANPAHLGDAVITTAVLRELKKQYPHLIIDVLCGSWSAPIFEAHPAVHKIYTLDLPMLNRRPISVQDKQLQYHLGYQQLKIELQKERYDLVASVYAYEPSYIPVVDRLLKAPIVGFSSAGYGPLLAKSFNTAHFDWHEVQHQVKVLEDFLGEPKSLEDYQIWLEQGIPTITGDMPYVVLHPGTGEPSKEWSIDGWQKVLNHLKMRNVRVVITGHGEREQKIAKALAEGVNGIVVENWVGRLSFKDFCQTIAGARLLISVESVAAHIASNYKVPTLIAAFGKTNLKRWQPLGGLTQLIDMRQDSKKSEKLFFERLEVLLHQKNITLKEGIKAS
ncbi:hypothetical protein PKF022_03190 [Polynucleobacter sp. KF022]|nr:hypothetical protein PKF022_03190 [Polynucleobacter sp. KF022]